MNVTVKTPYQRSSHGVPEPPDLSNVVNEAQDRDAKGEEG